MTLIRKQQLAEGALSIANLAGITRLPYHKVWRYVCGDDSQLTEQEAALVTHIIAVYIGNQARIKRLIENPNSEPPAWTHRKVIETVVEPARERSPA